MMVGAPLDNRYIFLYAEWAVIAETVEKACLCSRLRPEPDTRERG